MTDKMDRFETKISYVCKDCNAVLDTEEGCKEHIRKCNVRRYRNMYQGKYFIIKDGGLTKYLHVRRVFSDTIFPTLIECNIATIEYDCEPIYRSEKWVYMPEDFEEYINDCKPIPEKEFDRVFKERMSEITDYMLKNMKGE